MLIEQDDILKEKLKEIFGYSQFRGNQIPIIRNVLDKKDTFVIMPTGAGKSMCYQLPALMSEGVAIVISPLIALMKNQVDQLSALGVNAQFLNSTLTKTEMNKVKKDTLDGFVKLLYVAPESLTKEENVSFLKKAQISFVAVDEAHCISEWGHDFRPEYRRIRQIITQIGDLAIIALTATATPKVQIDIVKNLNIETSATFKSSFNRKNLYYEVRPKQHTKKQLIRFIKENKGKSGIIYCLSRRKVEEIASLLNVNDIKAAPYHAGLDSSVRERNQDAFLNEEVDVIVATIAFGMGIDKPDVRFVIHYNVPKSVEGYYQETGRAGRDGLEGKCVMFYSPGDISKLEKFNKDKSVQERENAAILLLEMVSYAESSICRRKQLLHYFGESFDGNCDACDNCLHPKEEFDGEEFVWTALDAVRQTKERFGIDHLVDVIRGVESQYVKSYNHDDLDIFGKGDEHSAEFWKSVVRQTLLHELILKDIDNVGVLKLSDKGRDFLENPVSLKLTKDHEYSDLGEEEEPDQAPMASACDEELFEILKALRKKVAKEKGFPPYVIFQDPSLDEMATIYPTSKEELARINGVGMGKVNKFGDVFMEAIQKYVKENDITTANDVVVKSAINKSKLKIYIIQAIDRKIDLDEISETKNTTPEEVLKEIENIIYSGTKLNLDYYINQVLDPERQEDLMEYFLNAETDDLQVAMDDDANQDYSEEEIRLMRIKFLSEYAN
jgi:ATP-dependent DNA helicase RecQ